MSAWAASSKGHDAWCACPPRNLEPLQCCCLSCKGASGGKGLVRISRGSIWTHVHRAIRASCRAPAVSAVLMTTPIVADPALLPQGVQIATLCLMKVPCFGGPTPPLTHALQGDDLALKYKPVAEEEGEQGWEEVYTMSLQNCMHGPGCTMTNCSVRRKLCTTRPHVVHSCSCFSTLRGGAMFRCTQCRRTSLRPQRMHKHASMHPPWYAPAACLGGASTTALAALCCLGSMSRLAALQVGTRLTRVTILSGSVVRVWGTLEKVLQVRPYAAAGAECRCMRLLHWIPNTACAWKQGGSSCWRLCLIQVLQSLSVDSVCCCTDLLTPHGASPAQPAT